MNHAIYHFEEETMLQANFLNAEMRYLDGEIARAKQTGDTKTYAALMRLYLNTQKEFMKLLVLMNVEPEEGDALAAFNDQYDGQMITANGSKKAV